MSDLPSHRLDGKREVPSYTSTTTDERDAVERVRRVADVLESDARAMLDPADLRTLLRLAERVSAGSCAPPQ